MEIRHAQIYGDPGQEQLGLDIVAMAADGSGVALQSKRVEQFGPSKITAAVDVFRNTSPVAVTTLLPAVLRTVCCGQADATVNLAADSGKKIAVNMLMSDT